MLGTADSVHAPAPSQSGIWAQLQETSSSLRQIDVVVFALILSIGALQFFYTARAPDFLGDDVFWADSARSLVVHGYYGINGYVEGNMPPGLPMVLALLRVAGVGGHVACLRALVVFGILGFLASYELLRRQAPRGVAAAACLLLMSSRVHFEFVTQHVWPSYLYLLAATCALLTVRRLDQAASIGWGVLSAVLIAASLMIVPAGMAFLGALVMSVVVALFRDQRLAIARLKTYVPIFLVGVAVQGYWMHRGRSVEASAGIGAEEWPVLGFPRSYLEQVSLKTVRYPELGVATLPEIGARMLKTAAEYSNLLSRMILQRMPDLAWTSVLVAGPLLLIAYGWGYSIWSNGGDLQDWYFAGLWFIYLLWPLAETRFFLLMPTLACLYLWRGGKTLILAANNSPRVLGVLWLPLAVLLAGSARLEMHGDGIARNLYNAGIYNAEIKDKMSFVVWLFSAGLAAWMIWKNHAWLTPASMLWRRWSDQTSDLQMSSLRIVRLFGMLAVPALIIWGLTIQFKIGRSNLDLNSEINCPGPDVQAGEWIRSHTDTQAVVMARHVPIVCHYAERKVIWFPPSSDSQLLMEGIRKHGPQYVIVAQRVEDYYLPPDNDCFAALLKKCPKAFRLVCQQPGFSVFQVVVDVTTLPSAPLAQLTGDTVTRATGHTTALPSNERT